MWHDTYVICYTFILHLGRYHLDHEQISALSVHRPCGLNDDNFCRETYTRVCVCVCVCKNIKTNITGRGWLKSTVVSVDQNQTVMIAAKFSARALGADSKPMYFKQYFVKEIVFKKSRGIPDIRAKLFTF